MSSLIKEIHIDKEQSMNTTPEKNHFKNIFADLSRSIRIFGSNIIKYTFKSGVFWLLAVILPLIALFFQYLIITGAFSLLPEHKTWLVDDNGLPTLVPGAVDMTVNQFSQVITQILVNVPIVIGLIVFPGFLSSSRESNLLKRLKLVGVSKEQMLFTYFTIGTLLLLGVMLVYFGPVILILGSIGNSIFREALPISTFYRGFVFTPELFFIVLTGIIGIMVAGYWFGMITSSSRKTLNYGLAIWISAWTLSSFSMILWEMDTFGMNFDGLTAASNWSLRIILSILKFLFLITPVTWYNVAVAVVTNPNLSDDFASPIFGSPISELGLLIQYWFVSIGSIVVTTASAIYVILNQKEITNFSAGR